ncbi:exodeoxyribonuclease III, partial [Lactobacillus nasalidis]|uniref:exodeoxyribonuclease III n=1 Tax=Lactobacillus nasalidis TaxID=2797258 RepID=UPI001915D71A
YTPNAGSGLARLGDRQEWDKCYRDYLQELDQAKPVLASGDFNAAYQEIDLKHPESNHHSAGFTDEERAGFGRLLDAGFTDTFRQLHGPVEGVYSWWAQRVRTAKANNSGWRIDYWLVSNRLADQVKKSEMIATGERADHCPILLEIDL